MSIPLKYERLNSTYAGVNSTACPSGHAELTFEIFRYQSERISLCKNLSNCDILGAVAPYAARTNQKSF